MNRCITVSYRMVPMIPKNSIKDLKRFLVFYEMYLVIYRRKQNNTCTKAESTFLGEQYGRWTSLTNYCPIIVRLCLHPVRYTISSFPKLYIGILILERYFRSTISKSILKVNYTGILKQFCDAWIWYSWKCLI